MPHGGPRPRDRPHGRGARRVLERAGDGELRAGLATLGSGRIPVSKVEANAVNALRRQRDVAGALGRAQYRAVLPGLAVVVADECLAATIEILGDHAEDPSEEELREALDKIRPRFPDTTIAVMLASVADGGMVASDLCYELLTGDERYGVSDPAAAAAAAAPEAASGPGGGPEDDAGTGAPDHSGSDGRPEGHADGEPDDSAKREERRTRRKRSADARRRQATASAEANERARLERKRERARAQGATGPPEPGASPRTRAVEPDARRAVLTPVQEAEFDRDDPWVGGVVFAWVPFTDPNTEADADHPDVDGKSRRCVVVAGSASHLLVRPGYSEGGVKGRTWKSVPLAHWSRAGFDQPTSIDVELVRVERPDGPPVGWLTREDWNALW